MMLFCMTFGIAGCGSAENEGPAITGQVIEFDDEENAYILADEGQDIQDLFCIPKEGFEEKMLQHGNRIQVFYDGSYAKSNPILIHPESVELEEALGEGDYVSISMEQADYLMHYSKDFILLDVRTEEEYEEKHIKGAQLLPLDEVEAKAEQQLPEKEQRIYVYCRSGNRSKQASEILTSLGYTNIIEIGGIQDWQGEVE